MLGLSQKKLYQIILSRDKRYDGRFYSAVKTTGIYCRPVCPARPKIENLVYFRSAAEAENAGYRPCLRCRPDLSPNCAQWDGTAAVVGRALTLISNGEADEIGFAKFSEKLGITDRHLRRLFSEHLGASPLEVNLSKRLHLAKQLLLQTKLPVTEIVYASGFQSLRRFNDAFKLKFKDSPSRFRKQSTRGSVNAHRNLLELELPYIAPFDWSYTFGFFGNHGLTGIETFDDGNYSRLFKINKKTGRIKIQNDSEKNLLRLSVSLEDVSQLRFVIEKVRDLFDIRHNPHHAGNGFGKKYVGIRIPGAWDSFETAVCIVLGQLVSVSQAKIKVAKLVSMFGERVSHSDDGLTHLFPSPEKLMNANLRSLGITRVREQAIKTLARLVFEKQIDLSRTADIRQTREALLAIPGIGPWTVEMISMRCLGDTNALPKGDLIIRRALTKLKTADWSPWNSYATLTLWKKHMEARK